MNTITRAFFVRPCCQQACYLAWALVLAVMLAGCSSPAPAETETVDTGSGKSAASGQAAGATQQIPAQQVPMEPFVRAYFKAVTERNFTVAGTFQLPAVWLFSPDGRLAKKIISEQELAALPQHLDANQAPQNLAIPFDLISGLLTEQFDIRLNITPDNQAWIALVLLSNQGCEDTCPRYEEAARRFEQAHPDNLRSIVLTLTR